ncbi:GNAT family N-acetyltransferase [Fictibacillus sp. Mic-4]|uniref:GNAT family N-acetyltransferase n=1 Tax=Fictibacillus sp. Mic-4 TaxID=3132826 RepID=UPI003CF1A04F
MDETIREASLGDFPDIEGLLKEQHLPEKWTKEHWESLIDREDYGLFVAEIDNEIVGFAAAKVTGFPETLSTGMLKKPLASITHVVVQKGHKDVHPELIQRCLLWARKMGADDFRFPF